MSGGCLAIPHVNAMILVPIFGGEDCRLRCRRLKSSFPIIACHGVIADAPLNRVILRRLSDINIVALHPF
jgi:hypothetical protein